MTEVKEEDKVEETPGKKPTKHKLPEGWLTPVELTHKLIEGGYAKPTLNSAQIYILSRAASKNGMPVKHFDAAGEAYDERQTETDSDKATTRPGAQWEPFLEWWTNRPKRQAGTPKEAAGNGKVEATAAEAGTEVDPDSDEDGVDIDDDDEEAE